MANILNIKTLLSGPRNLIIAVYMKSDGASGEFTNQTLIDPVDFGLTSKDRFRLVRLDYSIAGFDAVLEYASGGVTPTFKWVLSESSQHPVDFACYGNLIDDSSMDGTGKVQITTTGFTASTDQGSLLLQVRKP